MDPVVGKVYGLVISIRLNFPVLRTTCITWSRLREFKSWQCQHTFHWRWWMKKCAKLQSFSSELSMHITLPIGDVYARCCDCFFEQATFKWISKHFCCATGRSRRGVDLLFILFPLFVSKDFKDLSSSQESFRLSFNWGKLSTKTRRNMLEYTWTIPVGNLRKLFLPQSEIGEGRMRWHRWQRESKSAGVDPV